MKILIIVVYIPRYKHGHERHFVPPVTGIHLAAITPPEYEVEVVHQQVNKINYDTDADVIALSFFSGFAPEAYQIAHKMKQKGRIVIAGGPHVTFNQEEALQYVDAIVIGEAESIWKQLLADIEKNRLKPVYKGVPIALNTIPTPRYDLLPNRFFIKRVVQATRGCPYSCSFCSVPALNPGFRMRPIENVLNDITFNRFSRWHQRKIVWFWDDNLTINRKYIKELLTKMIPLKKWWLTQASLDIANDSELLDLMRKSGCIGVFFGIETFNLQSLKDANKKQNSINKYKLAIKQLHKRGIAVMAGIITGFDHDTQDSIIEIAENLKVIGIDVPFISVLTPFRGVALYNDLEKSGRLLANRGWEYYNGYNVAFKPKNMTYNELLQAHRELWRRAFSLRAVVRRLFRGGISLRPGALLLSFFMNVFYGYKNMSGNLPVDMNYVMKYKTVHSGINKKDCTFVKSA